MLPFTGTTPKITGGKGLFGNTVRVIIYQVISARFAFSNEMRKSKDDMRHELKARFPE